MTDAPTPAPREFRGAYTALRQAQKTSKGGPAYSVLVNRPLGRVLAAEAYVLDRTPNQVTVASAVCSFTGIAIVAVAAPTLPWSITACALLVVGYALDAADGQLARLRRSGSLTGEWLDHVVDAVKLGSIHLAVLVSWYRFESPSDAALLLPLLFQVVASVNFFVVILNDQLVRLRQGSTDVQRAGSSSLLYRLAVLPNDYGLLCLVFALRSWGNAFLWIYGTLAVVNAAFLLLALPRWFQQLQHAG